MVGLIARRDLVHSAGLPINWKVANIRNTENRNKRDRRDEARALSLDIAPGQIAGPPGEQRQVRQDLAFEVEHAGHEIVEECAERPVDMGMLPAAWQYGPTQRRAAVEAIALVRCGRRGFARRRFDRTAEHAAGHRVGYCFEFAHYAPLARHYAAFAGSC